MNVLLVAAVLIAVSFPILRRPRAEDDPGWALVLKLVGAVALYWVTFKFYKGGDADIYHPAAVAFAKQFRQGNFSIHIPDGLGLVGQGFIYVVGGVVYAIVGPSKLVGFIVFAWIGFWGLYFFSRAFQIAVSEETAPRYSRFVFFLPSLLFWSSSLGKDAWMVFTLGMASYGVARILVRRRGGFVLAALGLLGTAMVRPHVTLMIMVGVVFAYALRRSGGSTGHSRLAKIIGLAVIVGGSVVLIGQVEQFLNINKLDQKSINRVLATESQGSNYGGSAYTPQSPSLANFPQSAITVLFRPFPWETHSGQEVAASLEGLFLIGIFVRSWPRLRRLPRSLRRTPYVAYALAYSIVFMPFFSSFANFGLLVRERDQLYPLAFVLLAIPVAARPSRNSYRQATAKRSQASPRRPSLRPVKQRMPAGTQRRRALPVTGSVARSFPRRIRSSWLATRSLGRSPPL